MTFEINIQSHLFHFNIGMLNMRPLKPRYTHTWDMHLVTKYLACLGKTKLLPLKLLSMILAMLFALSCLEGASSLTKLDLRHCRVAPEGVFFTLVSPRKRAEALQINYLKPFCVLSTQRKTLSRWQFSSLS